jgi:hypothetical protein
LSPATSTRTPPFSLLLPGEGVGKPDEGLLFDQHGIPLIRRCAMPSARLVGAERQYGPHRSDQNTFTDCLHLLPTIGRFPILREADDVKKRTSIDKGSDLKIVVNLEKIGNM